jgi:hypothetical protein
MSLSNHLHRIALTDSYKPNLIAHRLILESRGKHLSEHQTPTEVPEAVLESVKGE